MTGRRRWWIAGGAVALVAALVVGAAAWLGVFANPSIEDAPRSDVSATVLVKDLRAPWGLAFLPDGSALVTERNSGRLLSVSIDGDVREVQRIPDVRAGGEGGLLGVAVSAEYNTDRWVYVYYTTASDNRVVRFKLGEQPQPILTGLPRAGNHNGGRIAFGPDGMLYVGTGDAGERDGAQDRAFLGGKILRLTPEGKPAPGNPFGDSPVYSLGHRNVQGLAWDAGGQLYAAEFGQNQYDELNRIEAGRNYGWPEVEGRGDDSKYANPVATWSTSDASPSGIAIAGDQVFMACLRGEKLYRVGVDGRSPEVLLDEKYGRLRHVALAPDGSLWVLTSNHDGRGDPTDDDDRILRLRAS